MNTSVYVLIKAYPEIKDIMKLLGFDSIVNPVMLNTVGKKMTIKKGASMRKIELQEIIVKFKEYGFELEDNNE
jgi:hypothetical protein